MFDLGQIYYKEQNLTGHKFVFVFAFAFAFAFVRARGTFS
jgi:hypothetical protein